MRRPLFPWILFVSLNAACLASIKNVTPGMIKVTIDTTQKTCTTLYSKPKFASAINPYDDKSAFCFGTNCSSATDPSNDTIILHLCKESVINQQLNLDPENNLKGNSYDNNQKGSGTLGPLLSDLQSIFNYIHSSLERLKESDSNTTWFEKGIDQYMKHLSTTLQGLNLPDHANYQHTSLNIMNNSLPPESLNKDEPGEVTPTPNEFDPIIDNIESNLEKLNDLTDGLSSLLAKNETITVTLPQIDTKPETTHSIQSTLQQNSSMVHSLTTLQNQSVPSTVGPPESDVNSFVNRIQSNSQHLIKIALELENLRGSNKSGTVGSYASLIDTMEYVMQHLKQLYNQKQIADTNKHPGTEEMKTPSQKVSENETTETPRHKLIIEKIKSSLEYVNRMTVDLSVLQILNNTGPNEFGIKDRVNLVTQDLLTVLNQTNSSGNLPIEEIIKNIFSTLENLSDIIDDLQILHSSIKNGSAPIELEDEVNRLAQQLGSTVFPLPLDYNITELLPALLKTVPDSKLADIIVEFTHLKDRFQKIRDAHNFPETADDELLKSKGDISLLPQPENIYKDPVTIKHIPELILQLGSPEIINKFWIPEIGSAQLVGDMQVILNEIFFEEENAGGTQNGYHRISNLICILLRLQQKGVFHKDLLKHIKYFYWILDTHRDGAMKSGNHYILKRKLKLLPKGDKPIDTLIETIKSSLFREIYWIPEYGGTEEMWSTIATLTEIFLNGEKGVRSKESLTKIICILITLQDTGLVNLKQVELDAMIKYLFPILESIEFKGTEYKPKNLIKKVDEAYNGTYSNYFLEHLRGLENKAKTAV